VSSVLTCFFFFQTGRQREQVKKESVDKDRQRPSFRAARVLLRGGAMTRACAAAVTPRAPQAPRAPRARRAIVGAVAFQRRRARRFARRGQARAEQITPPPERWPRSPVP